jgi:hypothetical protein
MAGYRSAWLIGWATVSLLGVCLALLLWSPGAVALLFAFAAATTVLIRATGDDAVERAAQGALRRWLRLTAVRAGAVGAGVVAAAALLSVAPHVSMVLLLLAGVTSPCVVRVVAARLADRARRRDAFRPDEAQVWSATAASAARALGDRDLCRAWCTSFDVLQSAADDEARARIVALRQAYLDELDRRDPLGLRAWLESGARATGNPDRYIGRPAPDRPRDDRGGPG